MSDLFPSAPRATVYTDGTGRKVIRSEWVGREGGVPPIRISWHDYHTGLELGFYSLGADGRRVAYGSMFDQTEAATDSEVVNLPEPTDEETTRRGPHIMDERSENDRTL